VKLIAPQLVKPYVKRGKNDAADAEALCEAMSRPTMRFVPVKTAEQQAALMLVSVRDRLIRNRTQLANAIRGYAAEFGLTAAKGMATSVRCSSASRPMRACPPWLASCSPAGQGICAAAGADRRGRCQAHGLASGR
jgi:transposase